MTNPLKNRLCAILLAAASTVQSEAHETHVLDDFEIEGRGTPLVGEAISASEGYVGQVDLETRPLLRTGDILEAIPGLIVTQHSGSGKANQYFLRGFNLDHGTDFSTTVDGMPVNMVTHGHGQGYSDINFVIPELVETIGYLKGSYYAAVGDFSSAGSAGIVTVDSLDHGLAKLTLGEDAYLRALVADSQKLDSGDLLFALERHINDGPWDLDEDLDKTNGVLKYTKQLNGNSFSLNFMGADSSWNSADQIPERAVEQGLISPLGSLDDTVGGMSSRYSVSTDWRHVDGDASVRLNTYAIYYDLNVWSNFTYFLDDATNGDQFEQSDKRMVYGLSASRTLYRENLFGRSARHTYGLQFRFDDIEEVGLYRTMARQRLSTVREDGVQELSSSAFYETLVQWTGKLKTTFGLRADQYQFDVASDLVDNSGSESDLLISPKFSGVYTFNDTVEGYASLGYGFHSNDARGATQSVDPIDGMSPVDPVDPLVRSFGTETGFRLNWQDNLNTSISLWGLRIDSELLYVGDAGSTEASRPSERYGVEIANHYAPNNWLSFDLDLAFTDASFRDADLAGNEIPGAIDSVASAGVSVNPSNGWFGSLRLRHFGGRPLVEDDSVRSDSFMSFNARVGFKRDLWRVSLDLINAFDSDDHDITYFYASRLPGEVESGVEDRHFHPIEPRSVRLNLSRQF